jgi:hypothetical protein
MTRLSEIDPNDYLIADPIGIDAKVQPLQTKLGTDIAWLTKSFSRAYREETDEGEYTPQIYIEGNEYISVFPDNDDSITGMSFFDIDENTSVVTESGQTYFESKGRIIFFVNLTKAYPALGHRADETVVSDIVTYIQKYRHGWEITNIVRGVSNVFTTYNWVEKEALINKQPYFVFSIECDINLINYKPCVC